MIREMAPKMTATKGKIEKIEKEVKNEKREKKGKMFG